MTPIEDRFYVAIVEDITRRN